MEIKTVDASAIFRAGFTACPSDPRTLILDVRDKKWFDKGHVAGAYCIRLPSSGNVLLGESQGGHGSPVMTPGSVQPHPTPACRCHRQRRRRRQPLLPRPPPRCLLQTTPRASTT